MSERVPTERAEAMGRELTVEGAVYSYEPIFRDPSGEMFCENHANGSAAPLRKGEVRELISQALDGEMVRTGDGEAQEGLPRCVVCGRDLVETV